MISSSSFVLFSFDVYQRAIFSVFLDFVGNLEASAERDVLERTASLYGANLFLKHVGLFYEVIHVKSVLTLKSRLSDRNDDFSDQVEFFRINGFFLINRNFSDFTGIFLIKWNFPV